MRSRFLPSRLPINSPINKAVIAHTLAVTALIASVVFSPFSPARAQDQLPSPRKMVEMADKSIASHEALSVEVTQSFDRALSYGLIAQLAGDTQLLFDRTTGLHASYVDDLEGMEVWLADSKVTIVNHSESVWAEAPISGTPKKALDEIAKRYKLYLPLTDVMVAGRLTEYANRAERVMYLGLHDANGQPSHHLIFQGERAQWQIWLSTDGSFLPLKLSITRTDIPQRLSQTLSFNNWNFTPKIAADAFTPIVPEGYIQAEFLPANADGNDTNDTGAEK